MPAVLQMMCAVPGADDRDFSSLRSIAYGASPITTAALKRSLEVFKAPLFQVYGLTETTGAITELSSGDHDPGGPRQHLMRSAGRPYPWVEMKAVDPVTGADCPPGRGRRDLDPVAAELTRLLEQARPTPRRPSTPTAGCTPATPATSTTRASCS